MADEIDDYIKGSRFVVILSGDGPFARLAVGWDAMIKLAMASLWDGDDLPPWLVQVEDEIRDGDRWARDRYGPFHFTTDLGEARLTIYRIQD